MDLRPLPLLLPHPGVIHRTPLVSRPRGRGLDNGSGVGPLGGRGLLAGWGGGCLRAAGRACGLGLGAFADGEAAFETVQAGQEGGLVVVRAGQEDSGADEFEQQPWCGRAAHLGEAGVQEVGGAGQLGRAHARGLGLHAFQFVRRNVEQAGRPRIGDVREDHQVTEAFEQVGGEPAGVLTALHHPVDRGEHRPAVVCGDGVHDLVEERRVGVAEQRDRAGVRDALLAGAGEELVEDRLGVTRGPRAGAYDQGDRGRLVRDALFLEDVLEELAQRAGRNEAERVVVRTGPDGPDDLLRLGRREDELQVRRRLFDELQQRVEALTGDHVGFVDDVNLEAGGHRGEEGALTKVTRVVDATVRRGVDLDDVDVPGAGRPEGQT